MVVINKTTIERAYGKLIEKLLTEKNQVGNTYEINNCCLVISRPCIKDYWLPRRNVSKDYLEAELKWYWSGDNSVDNIGKHAKMWYRLSDDGKTSNSAYGYILMKKYGFNQIEQIIELLKKDPVSRRAVLNISDPAINRIETKDMQCTVALQFLIRNGGLEETVYMRSNDVYFGLPYDYFFFVTLGKYIADRLGLNLKKYTHHATSMHMYLRDVEKFQTEAGRAVDIDWEKIIKENYR